jgi:hypothetical protein
MNMDSRHFAKMLVTQGIDCGQTPEFFENDIAKRAEAIRRPGESREQAFSRFATETDDGRLLFKAATMAARSVAQAAQDVAPEQKAFGPAGRLMNELAVELARSKSLTLQESYSRLIVDPARADLVRRMREEEKRATDAVTRQRWPMWNAERESQRWPLHNSQRGRT